MKEQFTSNSGITTHRSCPQKWFYGSIRRLEAREDIAVERDYGSWAHALQAAESIERGRRLDSLQWTPEDLSTVDDGPRITTSSERIVDAVLAASEKWYEQQSVEYRQTFEEKLGEPLGPRLRYVFAEWMQMWAEDIEHEKPLAVELHWERRLPALPQPDGGEVDPATTLIGYVDEVYYDTRRSMVVVRDHKFSKSLSQQNAADDMMESQLQIYAWGAAPTVHEWGWGSIRGVSYDRQRMVKPKEPRITQSGTLSKQVTDFDLTTYLAWAAGPDGDGQPFPGRAKDGSQAGLYLPEEALIEKLSTPTAKHTWFQRTLTPLNKNIVTTHLRGAVDTAIDMRSTRARAEVSGSAGRNMSSWGCRWCDFAKLCRAEMVGGVDGEFDLADYGLVAKARR